MVHTCIGRTLGIGYGIKFRHCQLFSTHDFQGILVVAVVRTSQSVHLEIAELLVEIGNEVTIDLRGLTVVVAEITIGVIHTPSHVRELIGEEGINTDTPLKLQPIGRLIPQRGFAKETVAAILVQVFVEHPVGVGCVCGLPVVVRVITGGILLIPVGLQVVHVNLATVPLQQ